MLDCTNADGLIRSEKGYRRGFTLLALLTKLHLECLKQIQSGNRNKFPEKQEEFLFAKIKEEVEAVRGSLIQLDAKHFKLVEQALIDYPAGDITIDKLHLVQFLISSYNAISETISGKEMPQKTSSGKELRTVELLRRWKDIIDVFYKDEKIKVSLDKTTLDNVNEYLNIKRDADSLYTIYSTIDSCKKYFELKGTIDEKRLVLQTVLQKVGEYLKSTSDTPNLSDETRISLEKKKIPVKLFTNFRDQIMHYQVFPFEVDGRDIRSLLTEILDPIGQIIRNEIVQMEKGFVQKLVQENAHKISDENIKKTIGSYAKTGIVGVIKYIEQMKGEQGAYRSLNVEDKRLVDEINRRAMGMKHRDLASPNEGEGATITMLDTKKLEIIEKCTDKSKSKVQKKLKDELNSWNLDLDHQLRDVSKIEEVVSYLQNTAPFGSQAIKGVDTALNNFLGSTEVLNQITILENDQWTSLKDKLEQYFEVESFIKKLPYSKKNTISSLINVLDSVKVDNNVDKKRVLDFLKACQKGSNRDYLEPHEYERLVKGLGLSINSEDKLLSYLVDWRRNKCISLLESNPSALKVICDTIMEGKEMPERVFKNLAYQYRPKDEDKSDTERRARSLQQSIEGKVEDLYLREVKKKIDVLGKLTYPDAAQMQFVSIYSLLHRTRNDDVDHVVIRKLRNYLAHGEQSEVFKKQFLQLIEGAVKKIDTSKDVTLFDFNKAVSDEQLELKLPDVEKVVGFSKGALDFCAAKRGYTRSRRSIRVCLFSKEDIEKFSKKSVDENNVGEVIIDSEKFLTYVKGSQDEGKNAQLIKFIEDKSIEGNYRYLVDRVVEEQGYERFIQNERIQDLYDGISKMDVASTRTSKLKGRLINAAGRIQLIRGIHGAVVSCTDGDSIDCGLSVSGMAWSFASQPIENVLVKTAPKVVKSAGQLVGKVIPGTLGRQAKFAVTFTGVKMGSKIAKGAAGAIGGVFDLVDIGMSANNLIQCEKRKNSNNPCGDKEMRDNIASISFSGVSFISGIGLAAAGMSGVGIAVGFVLMVGQGVYSGISNIIEYKKKYGTIHDENMEIFVHSLLLLPIPHDVQHLKRRSDIVNTQMERAWRFLRESPANVFAYGFGLGRDINEESLQPGYSTILMNRTDADTTNLSRVIPKEIENAEMICLPQYTNQVYEKGLKQSVPTAVHYCKNAMVVADKQRLQNGTVIVYNLESMLGLVAGSNTLNNDFLIFESIVVIIGGGSNTINRFILLKPVSFSTVISCYDNATNIINLSQLLDIYYPTKVEIDYSCLLGAFNLKLDGRRLVYGSIVPSISYSNYFYIGKQNMVDNIFCTYYGSIAENGDCGPFVDGNGGFDKNQMDIIDNCQKATIFPFTKITGEQNYYTLFVKNSGYSGKDLYSVIDVKGSGTIIFPEVNLLSDCSEIVYSSNNNTLSLKMGLGQDNQYALDIKNYLKRSSGEPYFVLIDKNGSNVVPKLGNLGSFVKNVDSFELYSEHSLDNVNAAKNHYQKILANNKGYKVLVIVRDTDQSKSNNTLQRMIFGSPTNDIIHFDERRMFASGGNGSDVYVVSSNPEKREIIIDNYSEDKMLDALVMPEVPLTFLVEQCNLHLRASNTTIQLENYFQGNNYRHLMVMSSKGEAFVPYVESTSCVNSLIENGKLLPFLHATTTQNVFLLPKDFQSDQVVIDSRFKDIERYKDKDDLLLVRDGEIPFIVKIEDFYNDQDKWGKINFLLWYDGNFSPYFGLQQGVGEVIDYQEKLKSDYEKSVKEYVIDFNQSVIITHNQGDLFTNGGQEEERKGIIILKDITPGRILVAISGNDLVFSDKVSTHEIIIKNWNESKSYRISTLEFDLGLEPIIIRGLDGFSLSNVEAIRGLVNQSLLAFHKNLGFKTEIKPGNIVGGTLLHLAAENGNLERVKSLIEQGVNINIKDSSLKTPLHYSVRNGHLSVVEKLIEKGAEVNAIHNKGNIPLHYAAQNGHLNVVEKLIEKGAEVNAIDNKGDTSLHYAAQNGHLSVVEKLVENEAEINTKNNNGDTPMHYAVRNGHLNVVEMLIKKGAEIDATNSKLCTPLHYAAQIGQLKVVEKLIVKGAEVDAKDNKGDTPLHYAAQNGHLNVVEELIEKGAKVDTEGNSGDTPLHFAAQNGHSNVIEKLIEKGAKVDTKGNRGNTPLHYAAQNGQLKAVEKLIEKGAKVDAKGDKRDTPLHYAAQNGHLNVVEELVNKEAEVDALGKSGHTPLHYAAQNGHLNVVEKLIEKGAKTYDDNFKIDSPLHYAVKNNDLNMIEKLLEKGAKIDVEGYSLWTPLHYSAQNGQLNVTEKLLQMGASVNVYDTKYWTPLIYAVQNGHSNVAEKLIEKGAEVDTQGSNLCTTLHYAAQNGHLEVVKMLIEKGADVDATDSQFCTPLHYAAQNGHLEVVKMLIKKGAHVDAKDLKLSTPLHYAAKNGRSEVVKYLIEQKKTNINVKNDNGQTPLSLAIERKYSDIIEILEKKLNKRKETTKQRNRRHPYGVDMHHGSHSLSKTLAKNSNGQPENASSRGAKPSLWINNVFSWVKSSVSRLLSLKSEGIKVDGQFIKTRSWTCTTILSDVKDKRQENDDFRDSIGYVNVNQKRIYENQEPVKSKSNGGNTILDMGDYYLSQVDFNGTITLLDLLIRSVTGQKYISTAYQSPLEELGYALNIIDEFETMVEQAAR